MLDSGTTITWEAWDQKYKPNQDWNHAWGAAPANLLPRYVLGVRPLEPGWARVLVQPHAGSLSRAAGRIPTPRGALAIRWEKGARYRLAVTLPPGTSARVELPAAEGTAGVWRDGKRVAATRAGRVVVARERRRGQCPARGALRHGLGFARGARDWIRDRRRSAGGRKPLTS